MKAEPATPAPMADSNLRTVVHLERAVSLVLRIGVSLSCAVLTAGVVWTLSAAGSHRAAARALPALRHGALRQPGWTNYRSVASVVSGVVHGRGPALVMAGVLLLIATPVLRVAVSVVGYALDGDRRFVVITTVVLAVLLGSFAIG
jgi:uncharacterized membrane protein